MKNKILGALCITALGFLAGLVAGFQLIPPATAYIDAEMTALRVQYDDWYHASTDIGMLELAVSEPNLLDVAQSTRNEDEVEREILCLAKNIYFEARNQTPEGMRAVAFVTKNRVESSSKLFPNDYCSVVYEGSERGDGKTCQFSWTCDGIPDAVHNLLVWNRIVNISRDVLLARDTDDPTHGSTFYHTTAISPRQAHHVQIATVIQDHVFYRQDVTRL